MSTAVAYSTKSDLIGVENNISLRQQGIKAEWMSVNDLDKCFCESFTECSMEKAKINLSDTKRKLLADLRGRLYPLGFKTLRGEIFTRAGNDGWAVSLSLESRMQAGLLICTPAVRATRSDISSIIEAGMGPYWQHPRRKRSASHAVFAKSLIDMAGIGVNPEGLLDFKCADAATIARAAKQIEAAVKSCLDEIEMLGTTPGVLKLLRKERRNMPSRYIREIAAVLFAEGRHRVLNNFIKGLGLGDTSPLDRKFCKYLMKLSRHGDEPCKKKEGSRR